MFIHWFSVVAFLPFKWKGANWHFQIFQMDIYQHWFLYSTSHNKNGNYQEITNYECPGCCSYSHLRRQGSCQKTVFCYCDYCCMCSLQPTSLIPLICKPRLTDLRYDTDMRTDYLLSSGQVSVIVCTFQLISFMWTNY